MADEPSSQGSPELTTVSHGSPISRVDEAPVPDAASEHPLPRRPSFGESSSAALSTSGLPLKGKAEQAERKTSEPRNPRKLSTQSVYTVKSFLPDVKLPVSQVQAPLFMVGFFVIGLAMSIGHVVCYARLNGELVPDQYTQEANLRYGTAFSFLSQITLTASVWQAYTQWLWRSLKTMKDGMTVEGLNAAFGVDTSPLSFLNVEMLRKLKFGSVMALFAWTLVLPPFFTPATLFVYPSTDFVRDIEPIRLLQISNASMHDYFAYSPPKVQGTTRNGSNWNVFSGPRTILSQLSTATASLGQILPIPAPYGTSSYLTRFYGPITRCETANDTAAALMDSLLVIKMQEPLDNATQTDNAYWAWVPVLDGEKRQVDTPRDQEPIRATNELWIRLSRYVLAANGSRVRTPVHQVCQLYNASYSVTLSWDNGVQNVSGGYELLNPVAFPADEPDTDLSIHSYSAAFWALTDQTVGTFGWYEETNATGDWDTAAQFGVIDSPIQHNSLLGSSDLDVFFNFEYEKSLYAQDTVTLGDQRLQDIELARNRTMDVLIEELSFNITVSLLHDSLLTQNISDIVSHVENVNRYGYQPAGLILPYVLANFFTLIIVGAGCISYMRHGVLGDKRFSDIASASRDPKIVHAVQSSGKSMLRVVVVDDGPLPGARNATVGADMGDGSAQVDVSDAERGLSPGPQVTFEERVFEK